MDLDDSSLVIPWSHEVPIGSRADRHASSGDLGPWSKPRFVCDVGCLLPHTADPLAADRRSVLTVTVNPAVDVSIDVARMLPDHKLRADSWTREPGGGGVNVARVLQRFGVAVEAFVIVGGATGDELVTMVEADGVSVHRFDIAGPTRESIAVSETSTGRQYRIAAPGPSLDEVDELREAIVAAAAEVGLVVLSGSLCPGMPADFYATIIDELGPEVVTIVDTNGPPLRAVAASSPSIIKPSQRELGALVGWNPATSQDIERAALEVLDLGDVGAVVASRGPAGALLVRRGERPMWFHPPPVQPVSTVGAGDSMVAGIAASLAAGQSFTDAVRFGVAAGTAAVITPGSALCDVAAVEELVSRVPVWTPDSDEIV